MAPTWMPIILEETAVCPKVGMARAAPAPALIFRNSRRFTSRLKGFLLFASVVQHPWRSTLACSRGLSTPRFFAFAKNLSAQDDRFSFPPSLDASKPKADQVCNCDAASMSHPNYSFAGTPSGPDDARPSLRVRLSAANPSMERLQAASAWLDERLPVSDIRGQRTPIR